MLDSEATLALTNEGFIEVKPHGHGDVYFLMYKNGIVRRMKDLRKKYFFVFLGH